MVYNLFFTQQIKISQMEAITVLDSESFTDFVTKKKYRLFSADEKNMSFKFISPKEDIYVIRRTETVDGTYVMYMINNPAEYSNIRQQLNENGYFYYKTENSEKSVNLEYTRKDNKYLAYVQIMKEFYKITIFPL